MRFIKRQYLLPALTAIFVIAGVTLFWAINLELPDFQSLNERLVTESTKIYDRTGKILLYNVDEGVRRSLVPPDEISKQLKNATVAIEDDQFYEHNGFKLSAILRALFVNLGSGTVTGKQGGSTITQQLIKNTLLTQDRKITRKIKEIFLALKLEKIMTKEEILGWYLNEVPYGGHLYGAEEASQAFFNHSARSLTLAEAAYLAAIPKAPTYYSPYGDHRQDLDARKDLVLKRMLELGFINQAEHDEAKAAKVVFQAFAPSGIKAPHFVMWVLGQLETKYGRESIRTKGFKVITTLDWEIQQLAEGAIDAYGDLNEKNFNAHNSGMVVMDPKTGGVLAMVGSRDYFNQEREGNFNITLAHRQPGSAFKPFVYATAFNKGFTPETMLFDVPTQFDVHCEVDPTRCYTPVNYDDRYRGPMSLREALAQSINIPSVKALYLAGIGDSIETARRMGIQSLGKANDYGLTLVLGGGEVSLLDLTGAYGAFANDGIKTKTQNILVVESSDGKKLEDNQPQEQRVLSENTARLISDILSDNKARTPTFGENSLLYFPGRDVAAKTGTTNNYRDTWIVGYTPNLVAGAWVGNNDNKPMERRVAGLIVAPLWNKFFTAAIKKVPAEKFVQPEPTSSELPPVLRGFWQGGQSYMIDKISGKLATEYTPKDLQEERVVKQVHSILYWLNRTNDQQFPLWEKSVLEWAALNGHLNESETIIPQALDDVHRPEFNPIVSLKPFSSSFRSTDRILIETTAQASRFPLSHADFFFNNNFLGSKREAPFVYSLLVEDIKDLTRDANELKVIVYDSVGNQGTATIPISILD
ncbi:MAG: PBP1A family penicillin-binding protein [Patescibacteria group bacterium]